MVFTICLDLGGALRKPWQTMVPASSGEVFWQRLTQEFMTQVISASLRGLEESGSVQRALDTPGDQLGVASHLQFEKHKESISSPS